MRVRSTVHRTAANAIRTPSVGVCKHVPEPPRPPSGVSSESMTPRHLSTGGTGRHRLPIRCGQAVWAGRPRPLSPPSSGSGGGVGAGGTGYQTEGQQHCTGPGLAGPLKEGERSEANEIPLSRVQCCGGWVCDSWPSPEEHYFRGISVSQRKEPTAMPLQSSAF